MNNEQHREDTKYVQWADGMYVMLDDLLCDYEKALVEDSLRGSFYFSFDCYFKLNQEGSLYGVSCFDAGLWSNNFKESMNVALTREQALYIATGDTDI